MASVHGDVFPGFAVQHLHVGHPVGVAVGDSGEASGLVQLHAGLDGGVDGVFQAGHLEEAAVLTFSKIHGPHFQRVNDLLASDLRHAHQIAVGVDIDDVPVSDIAGGDVGPDAAVDKADVGAQHDAVGVGAEVAQVGLGGAHRPLTGVGIVDGQVHLAGAHHLGGHPQVLLLNALNEFHGGSVTRGGGVHVRQRHQLGGHGAVSGDDQLADGLGLGAGLGQEDAFPFGVLHSLGGDHRVGVAVQHHIDAGGVGDHLGGHIGGGGGVHAQMGQGHHT